MGRASDALALLFELDADGEPAVKEFKRVQAAFAAELDSMKKMAAQAVQLSVVENRPSPGPGDGAAASKATLDAQREINRQLDAMWSAREKEQAASLKKQADVDRAFGDQQISTAKNVESEIAKAYKDRESQLTKTAKQSEDAWAKHEAAKLNATKQAEREGEQAVAAANAAKDKLAKTASDNFLKQQKQNAEIVAKANAQTAANEIRAALVAAKSTAEVSNIASKGIEALGEHLNLLVGHRIPLAGGAFLRLSENVKGFITLSKETEGSVLRLGSIIADLSAKTGKSAPEIKDFLNSFAKLGSQVEKDEAAVSAFGPALAQKLIPQLAAADSEMTALAASTGEAGGAFAAMAGPVGIAVLAVAAVVAAAVLAEKKMFDLAESTAKFEGKFVDLNQQTGLSVELLSAFDVLASTTDTDLGSLSASFGIFQKHLEEAQDPMSEAAGLLGELGIQTTDTETALRQAFETLAKMPEGFKQTALALQLFGRGGKSVLAIIKETNGDLDKAIKRFKDLGLIVSDEDAKAADEFNDELELLHRQVDALVRQLGKEFLPAAIEIVTALSDLVKASKEWFDLIGFIGKPVIDTFADGLRGLALVIALIRHDAEATVKILKDMEERRNIPPPKDQEVAPAAPPTGEESALKKAGEEARAVRAEVNETIRFAEAQLAAIDRQLRSKEISPAEALEPIIALERLKTEAEIKELEHRREARAKDFTQTEKDRQKQAEDIQAIDEEIANKRAQADQQEANRRAEFRAQELQREQAHRRALADVFVGALNDRIAALNSSVQAGTTRALFAQDVITRLLEASFAKRKEILEKERDEAGKDPALVQQINDQLADLQRERTAALAVQAARRIEILRDEQRKQLDLQRQTITSFLRASEIADSSRITTIKALAALRVKTEEQAAKDVLKIRLDAIRREGEVAQAERDVVDEQIKQRLARFAEERRKLEAERDKAKTTPEKIRIAAELQANVDAEIEAQKQANKDREAADTDFNNKIRVLRAQRTQIEADGNRDIDKGRQDDLNNARKYADDLIDIQRRTAETLRESQKLIIDLMIERGTARANVLRAQVKLEQDDENARHKIANDSLKRRKQEFDVQIVGLNEFLKHVKVGTAEEIEEYQRLSDRLTALKEQREALNKGTEAEEQRHELEMQRIHDEERKALERLDANSTRSLFGEAFANAAEAIRETAAEVGVAVSDLTVILGAFGTAAEEHFANASAQAGNFISILLDGIDQINAGLADMLENWILIGDTGPAALRKLLASTLAYYAKAFLIKALDNVAEGFSNLAKASAAAATGNFVSAALYHDAAVKNFISAAKYGLASAATAVAGRLAAGDSFKQKNTAGRAVRGGAEDSQPNNRTFNLGGQGPVETSSQASRDGSGGAIDRLIAHVETLQKQQQAQTAQIAETLARLKTAKPGDVVTMGAADARQAIGVAVIDHSNSSGDFNEQLQRNLGFA